MTANVVEHCCSEETREGTNWAAAAADRNRCGICIC